MQVVATTLGHAEAALFGHSAEAPKTDDQPVWVVIMKGHFTNKGAQLPPGATEPRGDTSVGIYSEGSRSLLDGIVGNVNKTAADVGRPVTTVTW